MENGVLTDVAGLHQEVVRQLAAHLRRWEAENPPTEPIEMGEGLSREVIEQLRSLGYLN